MAGLMAAVAASGDRAAFGRLFSYFAPRVKAYLLRLGAQSQVAEELAQEVMLTVWRKAAQFDARQSAVSTWIFTIARNRFIDTIRREKHPEFDPDDPALVPSAPLRPDESYTEIDREQRVRAALELLPGEQIDLLKRAFYSGKSHREIADDTGLPLGTVKSRMRLAFGRLRKLLDGEV